MTSLPLPIAAFVAGLISFLSPCVLPLVPGYVSLVSGVTVEELQGGSQRLLRSVMLKSLMFVAGFSVVFVMIGAIATTVGRLLQQYRGTLALVAGVIIVVFGLHLTGLIKINALYADKRMHNLKAGGSLWGAFLIGFAFAFGWTPCVGPILSAVIALAASEDTVARGMFLLAIYSMGLAVPFLLTSLGIERFLEFYARFRQHLRKLEVATGVLLIFFGVLIALQKFTLINVWLSRIPFFQRMTEYL